MRHVGSKIYIVSVALALGPTAAMELTLFLSKGKKLSTFFTSTMPCLAASNANSWACCAQFNKNMHYDHRWFDGRNVMHEPIALKPRLTCILENSVR